MVQTAVPFDLRMSDTRMPPPDYVTAVTNDVREAESDVKGSLLKLSETANANGIAVGVEPFVVAKRNRAVGHGAERIGGQVADSASLEELLDRCLLYTSPSPRDATLSRMPSSA